MHVLYVIEPLKKKKKNCTYCNIQDRFHLSRVYRVLMTAWWKSGPQMTVAFWQHSVAIQQRSVTWLSTMRTLSLLQQAVTRPSECGACGPVHLSVFCRPTLPPSHLFRWECSKWHVERLFLKWEQRPVRSGFVPTNQMGSGSGKFNTENWSLVINTLGPCSFVLLLKAQRGTLVPLVQMAWFVSGNSTRSAWSLSKWLPRSFLNTLSTCSFQNICLCR